MKAKRLRLLLLLCFLTIGFCFAAHAKAQDILKTKVSIHVQNEDLKKILSEIELKTKVKFAYNETAVKRVNGLTLDCSNETLQNVFEKINRQKKIKYEVAGDIIIIKLSEPARQVPEKLSKVISGKVTDEEGKPVAGASVTVKGTSIGTISREDGSFSLEIPDGNSGILEVSSVGYVIQDISTEGKESISILLIKDDSNLSEVVVVGYGTQKKSVITGAISSVKASDFANQQTARVEQVLQGRTSGVTIAAASGAPGTNSTVRIRGNTSLNNGANNPLYVVDGVVVDNGSIDYLSANDIESIEVLKDAASAAIYGARSSAGVILVTTKKGREGNISVSYNTYLGVQRPEKKLDLLTASQYAMLRNEQSVNGGGKVVFSNPDSLGTGTDWQSLIFNKRAFIQNHELSLSGGSNKSTFFTSFGFYDQDGIVATDISNYKRYNIRLNSIHKIRPWLTFGQNVGYAHGRTLGGVNANTEFASPLSSATNLDPITPITITDPAVAAAPPYSNQPVIKDANGNPYGISTIVVQQMTNPLAYIRTRLGNYDWSDNIIGNAFLELEPLKGLKARSTVGTNLAYWGAETFSPVYYLNANQTTTQTSFTRDRSKSLNWNLENTLSYDKLISRHHFTILLGQGAYLDNNASGISVTYYGIPATNFKEATMNYNVASTSKNSSGSEGILHKVTSLFSRLFYSFDEKYLFTGIIRRDGSSRFGPNKKFGYFPSASFGWVVTRENFLKSVTNINFLKLRASYGVTGNDVLGDLRYVTTVSDGRNYTFGSNDIYLIGYSNNAPANPDLQWEETRQLNLGLDATFLRNFTLTFDWFNKKTIGILMPVTFPDYAGVTGVGYGNIGNMENKGVELELGYGRTFNDFRFDLKGNVSYIKNRVTFLGDGLSFTEDGALKLQSSTYALTRIALGQPINSFYGFRTAGVFQNQAEIDAYTGANGKIQPNAVPGDFKWVDVNKDGQITAEDRDYLGDPTPDWTYGFTANAGFKNFDLTVFGQGVADNKIFQGLRRLDIPTANWQTATLNRWHGEGTSNSYPRLTTNDVNKNFSYPSDFYLQSGSYFRIKTLQIGYNLPQSLISRIGLKKLRLYLSSNNLLTITKYTGFDPEIGGTSYGVDRGIYPQAKSLLFGLNLTF